LSLVAPVVSAALSPLANRPGHVLLVGLVQGIELAERDVLFGRVPAAQAAAGEVLFGASAATAAVAEKGEGEMVGGGTEGEGE